ncbi:MAG: hypothetical protein AAFR11_03485 [Pseudomonadota bacterium]
MSQIVLRRGLSGSGQLALIAVDDEASAALAAFRIGEDVRVDPKAPRNANQHRLFFALLNKVVEGGGWEGTIDGLLTAVKLRLGHIERVDCGRYGVQIVPKSIRFSAMAQDRFREFFDRAAHLLLTQDMGLTDEARAEIVEALEAPYRDPRERAA